MKIIVFTLILLEVVQGMPSLSYRMNINNENSKPGYSNHFYITAEAASNLNKLIQGAMKLFDPNHWEYKKQLLEKHFQQKHDILAQLGKTVKPFAENFGNPSLEEKYPKNPGPDIKNATNPGVDTKNYNNPGSDGKNPEFDGNNPGLDSKNTDNPMLDADKIPPEIKTL